ncbi:hypothetical protein M405DRAFT_866613 [Rhizopogon salebrosus TDB-379]|nr:hypothetical protein M405DRAFT_866613 [Rhizopogon salebrosus TDB-379]
MVLSQVAWPDRLSKEELEDNDMQHPSIQEDLLHALFTFQSSDRAKVSRDNCSAQNDELTIPQQQRYLVSVELGRVERQECLQHYDQSLEAALVELGLDVRGVAASEGWQVDAALLRNVLRRLRGICTHPQVGQLQRSTDKLSKSGALKSIGEVLEESLASTLTMCWVNRFQAMRDQNCRNLMDDRKAKASFIIRVIHASED